jgi:DNA excision repair protein ERCC-4
LGLDRYREEVHASLGQRKADVIELYQPLTRKMSEIQVAIVECMDATLAELRKSCTGVRPGGRPHATCNAL